MNRFMKKNQKIMAVHPFSRYIHWIFFVFIQSLQYMLSILAGQGDWEERKASGRAGFSRTTQVTEPTVPHSAWGRFSSRTLLALEVMGGHDRKMSGQEGQIFSLRVSVAPYCYEINTDIGATAPTKFVHMITLIQVLSLRKTKSMIPHG